MHDSLNINGEIKRFLQHCKFEKNLSKKTIKAYTIDLNQFLNFLKNSYKIENIKEITKEVIRGYLEILLEKFKIKTVKRKTACLKAFFNYLEFEEIIILNPFRKMRLKLKEPFRLPCVMTLQEIEMILRQIYFEIKNYKNKKTYSYKSIIRDIAVIELLFATGLRVSELCSLKNNDIDLETGAVKVWGKGSKERVLYICEKPVKKALTDYLNTFKTLKTHSEYFFINRLKKRLSEQSVRFMINKYIKKLDLKKHITPHVFRHTFATLLLEEGVDIKYIQHFLGHSSIMTTQIYTHVNLSKKKDILQLYHPRRKIK